MTRPRPHFAAQCAGFSTAKVLSSDWPSLRFLLRWRSSRHCLAPTTRLHKAGRSCAIRRRFLTGSAQTISAAISWSRVIYGARASLLAGVISVGIALSIGVPLGLAAGYLGGFLDALIGRMTDAMLACPFLILAIALAAFLGPSLGNAMIAIGVTATPIFVRLTRGQVLAVKMEDYVEAARAVGNPRWRIVFVHILPNIMPALLVQATLSIAAAIIAEAALSFLGLGQQPPDPSWGSMLNSAQRFLVNAPWMAVWPGSQFS